MNYASAAKKNFKIKKKKSPSQKVNIKINMEGYLVKSLIV